MLKPTDFSQDTFLVRAVSPGGTALMEADQGEEGKDSLQSIRLAGKMVPYGGAGGHDLHAINASLRGKVVQVTPFISEYEEGITGHATPSAAKELFQLMHLYVLEPRRNEYAFGLYREYLRESLRNRDRDPLAVYHAAIDRELWQAAPRRQALSLEGVAKLDLDRAFEFYRQRFSDVSDFVFVFVGDLDERQLRPLVERYLASLPGNGRKDAVVDLGLHRKPGVTRLSVKAGQDDRAMLTLIFHGESPWSEFSQADLISLQDYLQIRLREVLREELGIVYDVRVSSSYERTPSDRYSLSLQMACNPRDLERLRKATWSALSDLEDKGPNESIVEKLVQQRTLDFEKAFRSNAFWATRLSDSFASGEDPLDILSLRDLPKRVTGQNIRAAARAVLRDDQYLDAELLPQ